MTSPQGSGWYRSLLWLYGAALLMSNPMVAFGFFYVVLAIWIVLVYVSLRYGPRDHRYAAVGLLASVLVWLAATASAFLYLLVISTLGWYLGELASIGFAAWVMSSSASGVARDHPRADAFRKLGLAWGLVTATLMLVPFATYLIPGFEAAAIFNPVLFFLPYLIMLVTAVLSIMCFALVPVYARRP